VRAYERSPVSSYLGDARANVHASRFFDDDDDGVRLFREH
jgi:hypothetical protein